MSVVAFSEKVHVSGEVTRQQLAKLSQISRRGGGCQLDSWDIAVIRAVVEALKVKRSPTKSTSVGIPGS